MLAVAFLAVAYVLVTPAVWASNRIEWWQDKRRRACLVALLLGFALAVTAAVLANNPA